MKIIRFRAVAIFVALFLVVSPLRATSFSTDQSDLWNVPSESGWGMQLVQRGSLIFATIFIYDPTRNPIWYTALLSPSGPLSWTGALYLSNGPWFGTIPFDPTSVLRQQVGAMTWVATSVSTGTLTYTVNGVEVAKEVSRETLVLDDFSGHYGGGIHVDIAGCVDPSLNGTNETAGFIYITQSGQAISIQALSNGVTCTYPGNLSQDGQMGGIHGNYVCSDGDAGTFAVLEMQVNISGITARINLNSTVNQGCHATGWFGGARATTF